MAGFVAPYGDNGIVEKEFLLIMESYTVQSLMAGNNKYWVYLDTICSWIYVIF